MGLHDLAHSQTPAELEKPLVLVRCVDEQSVATQTTAHHEDVVVQRADDNLVDLDLLVLVVHGWPPVLSCSGRAGARDEQGTDLDTE